MTDKERADMMAEIMGVVDKHLENSEKHVDSGDNDYTPHSDNIHISNERMKAWKEEYKRIRVDGKTILEEVRRNPIDVRGLESSFDLGSEYTTAIAESNK